MIDPKSLRIGNLIHRKYSDTKIEVDKITGYDLWHSEKLEDVIHLIEYKAISPIEITEEWINKLQDDILKAGWWFEYFRKPSDYWLNISETESVNVKYIHQLQNIYFAIKGQELEIK